MIDMKKEYWWCEKHQCSIQYILQPDGTWIPVCPQCKSEKENSQP